MEWLQVELVVVAVEVGLAGFVCSVQTGHILQIHYLNHRLPSEAHLKFNTNRYNVYRYNGHNTNNKQNTSCFLRCFYQVLASCSLFKVYDMLTQNMISTTGSMAITKGLTEIPLDS